MFSRRPRAFELLLGVVVALELAAPFVANSYGVDGPSQLNLIKEFTGLVAQGVWLPRWAPEGFLGFGVASFYFYPPLAFYIATAIRLVTGVADPRFLFQATGLLTTIASVFTARYLMHTLGARGWKQNLAALLYAFAPFQIAELYSRSSITTHVGYTFLPLVWAGLVLIVRDKGHGYRGAALFGIASALLALTNVPFAMLTAVCIGIAALVSWRKITPSIVAKAALGALLAACLTSFHFASVIFARPFARLEDLHVIDPEYLLTDLWHHWNYPAGYHVGLHYIVVGMVAFALWKARRSKQALTEAERLLARIGIAVLSVIAFLEIPVVSVPVWVWVPPLPLIQGVWRFYSHIVLFAAVFVAIATTPTMQRVARRVTWLILLGALLPALLVVSRFHLYAHTEVAYGDPSEYRPCYTVSRDSVGITIRPHEHDSAAVFDARPLESVQETARSPRSEDLRANLISAKLVTFHRFQWPAWHLYANGRELATRPDSIGRATAILPEGHTMLHWQLERTPIETAGLWISGLTAGALLVAWGIGLGRRRVTKR